MTAHLAHAGLAETIGWSAVAFALMTAVLLGGGASGRLLAGLAVRCWRSWLAYGRTRAAAMRRRPSRHRPAHRARRPHPRVAAVALAAHLTLTRHTHGGTR